MSDKTLGNLRRHLDQRKASYERHMRITKFKELSDVRACQLVMDEIDYLIDVVKDQERLFIEDGD